MPIIFVFRFSSVCLCLFFYLTVYFASHYIANSFSMTFQQSIFLYASNLDFITDSCLSIFLVLKWTICTLKGEWKQRDILVKYNWRRCDGSLLWHELTFTGICCRERVGVVCVRLCTEGASACLYANATTHLLASYFSCVISGVSLHPIFFPSYWGFEKSS